MIAETTDTTTYERDGVLHIPGVFADEVFAARVAVNHATEKAGIDKPYRSGLRLQVRNSYPALQFWPVLVEPYLDSLRRDERLQDIVRTILGDDVKQLNCQAYFRLSGDGDAFAWHQDSMFRRGMAEGFDPASDYLQTIICVDAMSEENGGVGFILGSHRCTTFEQPPKEHLRVPDGPPTIFETEDAEAPLPVVFPTCEAGDVVVWNANTVHGSGMNESGGSRITFMNGFARAEACEAWPWYLKDGALVPEVETEAIPYT